MLSAFRSFQNIKLYWGSDLTCFGTWKGMWAKRKEKKVSISLEGKKNDLRPQSTRHEVTNNYNRPQKQQN